MRKFLYFFVVVMTLLSASYWYFKKESIETITYFPEDPEAKWLEAETRIRFLEGGSGDFRVLLSVRSELNKTAYLRQDISFLFANNRLIGLLGKWEQNVSKIEEKSNFSNEENVLLLAVSFHHAELHGPFDEIKSSQTASRDKRYIIKKNSLYTHFSEADTEAEKDWQWKLDRSAQNALETSIQKAVKTHGLKPELYYIFPLNETENYFSKPLPGFSKNQSRMILGQLIEGVYKNYYLGIKTKDGAVVNPIGSTIPVIWLAKNKQYLYVTFETMTGEAILLKQKISL